MYHTADIKNWFHHMHMPNHQSIVHVEKMFMNKQMWGVIGIIALAAFLILLAVWAASLAEGENPSPVFYPYGPIMP